MAKKRQRCSDLLDHLLPKLFAEQNEDQALRLGHLALISDEPDNAEKLAHNKRCKNVLDVCWQVIGSDILTSHDDSISILVNLLVPSATRSEVFRGLAEFAREKGSIEMLLKHVDMPALGHHLVKAVSRCGNVEERDVAQACSLTAASMENAEDRVAFCNFIISQDGGDSFMLKLFDAWPWQFGSLQLIETLDSFLISPVDNLMWDAQTANRQEFAEKWLTFLIRQFLEPASESTTSMHALGDTLQVKDSTFRQILLTQESLLEHLVSNLVVSLLTNRQDQCRIRAAMYAALHVASSREPSALKHLANHARFDTLVALAVENMQLAMEEIGERKEHDIINVLTIFLQNEATKKAVLAGSNVKQIINSISLLLAAESSTLLSSCLELLQTLVESIDSGALLGAGSSLERLIPRLCSLEKGRDILYGLIQLLQWWPRYTQLISLDFKSEWLSELLQENSEDAPAPVRLEVQREQLLASLCAGLAQCSNSLSWGIDVSFTDESDDEGEEDSNHRQEFFRLAADEFMKLGLFVSKDGRNSSFHINPEANSEEQLRQFELCGKVIGLALLHQETVPSMRLSPALRKLLLSNAKLGMEDLAAVDPQFYQSHVLRILEGQYTQEEPPKQLSDLGLTFEDEIGGVKTALCWGGAERVVSEENKSQYIEKLCHHRLLGCVRPQVDALLRGVHQLISPEVQSQLQRTVSAAELGMILCGATKLNLQEWKEASTKMDELSPEAWQMFWEALEAMTPEQQNGVLEFATGSFHLPEGGLAVLQFSVAATRSMEPTAVPCFSTLYLPSYNSVQEMREALVMASYGHPISK